MRAQPLTALLLAVAMIIAAGPTTTAWCGDAPTSSVQTDQPQDAVSLAEALDNADLSFTTGGDAVWAGQTTYSHDGADAAQSGAIGNVSQTWLETTVSGPGQLSFWWRVSSEAAYDYLRFYLDGEEAATGIAGESAWAQVSVEIPAGSHTLRWSYIKDTYVADGSDAGWVDQVVYTPTTYSITPTSQSFEVTGGAGTVLVEVD